MKCLLLCLSLYIAVASAQTCTTWSEQEYDTSADDYSDGVGTPRGFLKAEIPNPETARDTDYPCITVTADDAIQYMEVLIETQNAGTSNICIDVEGIEGSTCNGGSVSFCDKIPSLTSTITFNCDSGCDQSSVAIYFRANLSRSDIDDEYWCSDRRQDYPSGLITFVPPSDITPRTPFTESAPALHSFSATLLVAVCLLALAMIIKL